MTDPAHQHRSSEDDPTDGMCNTCGRMPNEACNVGSLCPRSPTPTDDEVDLAHVEANSPPVTLALVARIRELEAAADRAVTIADEAFGLGPVESIDATLGRIERGISEQHRRICALESWLREAVDRSAGGQRLLESERVQIAALLEKGAVLP